MRTPVHESANTLAPVLLGVKSRMHTMLIVVLVSLAAIHILSDLPGVIKTVNDYQTASKMESINQASISLIRSIRFLGYERGRTFVELYAPADTEDAATGRVSIKTNRQQGDTALSLALDQVKASVSSPEATALAKALTLAKEKVSSLRERVDHDLVRELYDRDKSLPGQWLAAIDGMFESMENVLAYLSRQASQTKRGFTKLALFRLTFFGLRRTAGPETAFLSAVIATGQPISPDMRDRIITLRAQAQQYLSTMFDMLGTESDPRLMLALSQFRDSYNANIPNIDKIMAAASTAGPYHMTRQELLANGRNVLEKLTQLAETSVTVWSEESSLLKQQAANEIVWGVVSALLVFCFILVGLFWVLRYVADPVAAAMNQSNSLLSSTLESTTDGILVSDGKGRLVLWNRNFLDMWGLTEELLVDRDDEATIAQVVSQLKNPDQFIDKVQKLYSQPEAISLDLLEFKDGRVYERHSRPQKIGQEIIGRVWTFSDVTERKRSEARLTEMAAIVASSQESIISIDLNGNIISWNPGAQRLYGYTASEALGKHVSMLVPEDGREKDMLIFAKVKTGEPVNQYETVRKAKNGRLLDVSITLSPLLDSSGGPVGASAIARDISDRKRAERAVRDSEERYRILFDISPYAIVIHIGGRIILTNKAATILLGAGSPTDIIGLNLIDDIIEPEFRDLARQRLSRIIESGMSVPVVEYRFRRLDGYVINVEATGRTINYDGQEAVMSIYRDVTETKKAEKARAKLEAQLRQAQKMEAIGTLAGGIAHDFNNILAAILGFTELAQELAREGLSNISELERVLQAGEKARNLVQQILAFSRKAEVRPQPISLNRYVKHTLELLRRTIPKMISIETKLDPNLQLTNTDPTQLEQVIMNLAINAADAIGENGKVTIETKNVTIGEEFQKEHPEINTGDYILLRVMDTGCGIGPETISRIFDPFFTTKELGKGTGLGLSTVYGIVKSNHGYIYCQSEVGKGTSFEVYLPALDLETLAPSPEAKQSEQIYRGSERLLIVDDDESLLDLASRVLSRHGYQVEMARSGEEALEAYQRTGSKLDLVIMDLGMPGMGGYNALQSILEAAPNAKVIISSGYAAEGQINEALAKGAVDYVAKPFKLADLLATVRRVLDGQG